MCGIAAIISYGAGAGAADVDELRRIRDHMAVRGPDGFGEWTSRDGCVVLGHRRLSIIDLSDRGTQPLQSVDGRYTITFNGEIYNYRALREDLVARGCRFHSDTDTEVVIQLWAIEGEAMFARLRGMFAFALHDAETGEVILARDPYGIKPLYYADGGGVLRVASQVKAILAGGAVARTPEPAALAGFLLFGSVPEPFTVYEHVRELPAGSWCRISQNGMSDPKHFYSLPAVLAEGASSGRRVDEDELFARVREALTDSVAHHMVADVPVGAFLSAGIDSGSLVALARDAGVRDLQTVTLAFEEYHGRVDDEAPLAAEVAAIYGTDHVTRPLGVEEFEADLERLLEVMDQPSIDGVNTYFVSKAAAERGLKVVLSGLGGDELFAGYNTFADVPRWVLRLQPWSRVPGLPSMFRSFWSSFAEGRSRRSPKLAGALTFGGTYPGAYFLRRGVFLPWELEGVLGREMAREGLERLRFLELLTEAMTPDPGTPYGRVAALEAGMYMRNQLLRDTDWAGMAHSLEVRVPLVDAWLLRALAPLLHDAAPKHRKELLALAPSRPLPERIRRRPKTGFQVPIPVWLETHPAIDAWKRVPRLAQDGCPWTRRWAYTVLEPLLVK